MHMLHITSMMEPKLVGDTGNMPNQTHYTARAAHAVNTCVMRAENKCCLFPARVVQCVPYTWRHALRKGAVQQISLRGTGAAGRPRLFARGPLLGQLREHLLARGPRAPHRVRPHARQHQAHAVCGRARVKYSCRLCRRLRSQATWLVM